MRTEKINEIVAKQVAETTGKIEKKSLLISGLGLASLGLLTIVNNKKLRKEQNKIVDTIEAQQDAILDRIDQTSMFATPVNESTGETEKILTSLNETLEKQNEIFDRINFQFDQQEEYYAESEKVEELINDEENQEEK